MEIPNIVKLVKNKAYSSMISAAYREEKRFLHEDFQDIDDDLMISHAKAYMVGRYLELNNDREREHFLDIIRSGILIIGLIDDFIKSLNAMKSKIGDHVHDDILYDLKALEKYKDTDMYKKLSKGNNRIASIIKEYHGYVTLKELKEKCHDEPLIIGDYKEYIISEEEIKIIEATKNHPLPNQIAHLLFDYRKNNDYRCDHKINNDNEVLKNLLVNTKQNSPRYDIIFEDGTIVNYNEGDIRIRPYNFKQVLRYTKLYFVQNFDEMYEVYTQSSNIFYRGDAKPPMAEIERQMILNSFVNVLSLLIDYEDIYTKRTIEDSKKNLVKIKEIAKKYDL